MNPQETQPPAAQESEVSERLWQEWLTKTRARDGIGARNRLRLFKILIVLAVVAAFVYSFSARG